METALHSHDILTAELAEDKLARVALYCRYREVGDVCVCKFIAVGDFSGKLTEASTENDSSFRICCHPFF